MRSLIPWRRQTENLFEGFNEEMNQLMKRFFGGSVQPFDGSTAEIWAPSCDVEETEKEIIVKADLPGVDPKDVDISVNNGMLTLRGEKKSEKEDKEEELPARRTFRR